VVRTLSAALVFFVLASCGTVRVTKTDKVRYNPTDPNKVEILLTRPEKPYEELGTVKATGFGTSGLDNDKMYSTIRVKVAPLGANAVILSGSHYVTSYSTVKMWVEGVAIRYKTEGTQN
jgi:hypothetical protein